MHVHLPAPSLSIRVWNETPDELMIKAAKLTRTGIGLPAYYNDEVIIPAIMNRGVSLRDARVYNIIGCVEPQEMCIRDRYRQRRESPERAKKKARLISSRQTKSLKK